MNKIVTHALRVVKLSVLLCVSALLYAGQSDVCPGVSKEQLAKWQKSIIEKPESEIRNFFVSCSTMLDVKNLTGKDQPSALVVQEVPLLARAAQLKKTLDDVEKQTEKFLIGDAFARLTNDLHKIAQETDQKFQEFISSLDQDECSKKIANLIKSNNSSHWNFVTGANQPEKYAPTQLFSSLMQKTQLLVLGRCLPVHMQAVKHIKGDVRLLDNSSQAIRGIVERHLKGLQNKIQKIQTSYDSQVNASCDSQVNGILLELRNFVEWCEKLELAHNVKPLADADITKLRDRAVQINNTCMVIPQCTRQVIAQTIKKIDDLGKSKDLCGDAIRRIAADDLAGEVQKIEELANAYEGDVKKFNRYVEQLNANQATYARAQEINAEFHELFSSGEHAQFGMKIALLIGKAEKLAQQHNIKLTSESASQPQKTQPQKIQGKSPATQEKTPDQTLAQHVMSAAKKHGVWLGALGVSALAIIAGYRWYCSEPDDEKHESQNASQAAPVHITNKRNI